MEGNITRDNMTKKQRYISTLIFLCVLQGCSANRWKGGLYEGDPRIDNVRPTDAKVQKFSLVTTKAKRFIRMDASNTVLANCDLPIDDKYTAGITDDSRFTLDLDSAICGGLTVHSGDLTLEKEQAIVTAVIVDPSGRSYTLDIKGFRK